MSDQVVVFLDHCVGGPIVPDELRELGVPSTRYAEVFPPGTPDHVWVPHTVDHGLLAVTADRRVIDSVDTLAAIIRCRAIVFVFGGNLRRADFVRQLAAAYPAMVEFVSVHTGPAAVRVNDSGKLSVWYGADALVGRVRRNRR